MPQTITTTVKSLVDAAEREVETLSVEDAIKLHADVLVDRHRGLRVPVLRWLI